VREERSERDGQGLFTRGGPQGPGRGPAPGAPNAGRPKDSVRQAALLAFEERLDLLCAIADGTLKGERVAKDGTVILVGPSVDERRKALCDLARLGGVEELELDQGGDGEDGPAKYGLIFMPTPDPKPVPPGYVRCPDCQEVSEAGEGS